MKTVYVCNVSNAEEQDEVLKLPSSLPQMPLFERREPSRALRANPSFGAGADEEPLPMPTTYDGKGEVAS